MMMIIIIIIECILKIKRKGEETQKKINVIYGTNIEKTGFIYFYYVKRI